MKWYDYIMCLFFADLISAAIMVGSWTVVITIIMYFSYEDLRKWMIDNSIDD